MGVTTELVPWTKIGIVHSLHDASSEDGLLILIRFKQIKELKLLST